LELGTSTSNIETNENGDFTSVYPFLHGYFTWEDSGKTYIVEQCQQTIGHSPKNGWSIGVSDSWIVIILDGYKYMYRVVQAPTIMKQLGALKLLCIGMEDLSVFG
jgi:hypothetical protein